MKLFKMGRYSKFEKRDFFFVYMIVLFPVLQFAIFWFYVNASSIFLAFEDTAGKFTLNNFKTVYNAFVKADQFGINLKDSLFRSMILWGVGELICFPISLITTYVLTKEIAGHYFFRVCYIIPSLIGAIIWTILIKELVQYNGPITLTLLKLGVNLPEDVVENGLFACDKTAFPTIVIIRFIMGLVGNNAVLTGAFTRVPDELFESAKLDGAGFYVEMFQIAIPCIWSTITTLLTFSLCSIFTCDYNVYLLTNGFGDYGTSTIGFQLFNLTYRLASDSGAKNYGYPAALGLCLTIITFPVVVIGKRILEKISENVEV